MEFSFEGLAQLQRRQTTLMQRQEVGGRDGVEDAAALHYRQTMHRSIFVDILEIIMNNKIIIEFVMFAFIKV
jgi:hypothetical protein